MAVQLVRHTAPARRLSPFQSYALYLWTQYRWFFAMLSAPWLFSAVVDHFCYAGQITALSQARGLASGTIVQFPALLILAPIFLLTKLDATLWTLPIRTRTLVGWTAALGAISIAFFWIATAVVIWRPVGLNAPIWWPAAALAAAYMAILTAASRPDALDRRTGVRYILIAAVLAGCLIVKAQTVWRALVATPEVVLFLGCLVLAAIIFPLTVARAEEARMGETKIPNDTHIEHKERADRAEFRTQQQAQIWFEWRSNRWGHLISAFGLGALALILPLLMRGIDDTPERPNYWRIHDVSSIDWMGVGLQFATIVFWSLITGAFAPRLMRRCESAGGAVRRRFGADMSMTPFVSIRPLKASSFIAVQLHILTLRTAVMWAALIPAAAVWFFTPAILNGSTTTQGDALFAVLTASGNQHLRLLAIAAVLGSIFLTWAIQTEMLTLSLTGRYWAVSAGYYTIKLALLGGVLAWLFLLSTLPYSDASAIVSGVAVFAAGVKALILARLIRRLKRRKQIPAITINRILAAWAATAFLFFILLSPGLAPAGVAWWNTALGVFLLMPGLGLSLAPEAIEWDRSR